MVTCLGHANLLGNFADLDLDVDLDELLGKWVDLDKARVDGAMEAAKFCNEANIALSNWFVGIRADHAAWNGTKKTDTASKRVDHAAIPAMRTDIIALESVSIRRLQVISARRFDHEGSVAGDIVVCAESAITCTGLHYI